MKKLLSLALLIAAPLAFSAKSPAMPKGLTIKVEKQGSGPAIKKGQTAEVNYTGTLKNGTKFDSSLDRNQTFKFVVGKGEVIKGWDLGVEGMKKGETRKLVIASDLAYGPAGRPPVIPQNAELTFVVTLEGIQ
jgi:FKBP-type peptidyl-prolyl cis-trans isomerase